MVPNSYDVLMTVFMTVSEAFDAVFIKKLNKTLLSQNLNLKHVIDFYLQKKVFSSLYGSFLKSSRGSGPLNSGTAQVHQ